MAYLIAEPCIGTKDTACVKTSAQNPSMSSVGFRQSAIERLSTKSGFNVHEYDLIAEWYASERVDQTGGARGLCVSIIGGAGRSWMEFSMLRLRGASCLI